MKKYLAITWSVSAVLWCCPASFASWISEIQPQPRQVNNITGTKILTLQTLIEVSGLSSLGQAQIVIINASTESSRYGRILQTIPIGDGGDVRLIQDPSLNLDGPRSLLLFDGITGLVANSNTIPSNLSQNITAQLLDVVTYGPAGLTSTFDGEPVLEWSQGQVLARPMRTQAQPWENQYIVGTPDFDSFVTETNPSFQLNPGLANPIWQPLHTPTPNTTALLAVLGIAMWPWRRANTPGS